MIDLLALPFGKQLARRRAYRHAILNLALQILPEATQRSGREAVGTIEVRLALHVLRPFVRDATLLTEFWDAATVEPRHPGQVVMRPIAVSSSGWPTEARPWSDSTNHFDTANVQLSLRW